MWFSLDHYSKEAALGPRYRHERVVSLSHTCGLFGFYFTFLFAKCVGAPPQYGEELGAIRPLQLPVQ